jgi:HAMP domain-containing protein
MLLDRLGVVKCSSQPQPQNVAFSLDSPTCQACHQFPPAQRQSSRVIDAAGGTVLRTMVPVRNQPRCQKCHDPSHNINGVLVFDMNTRAITAGMDRDLRMLVLGTGAIALVLIAVIAIVVRLVLLRRLQRFETTASLIAKGDLERRVPGGGRTRSRGSRASSTPWLTR